MMRLIIWMVGMTEAFTELARINLIHPIINLVPVIPTYWRG